jgi:hypothetical protein
MVFQYLMRQPFYGQVYLLRGEKRFQ